MMPISQHGCQLDKVPWPGRPQHDAHLKALRLAHEIARNYDVKALTRVILAKNRLAGLVFDAPCLATQQISGILGALQQLCERSSRRGGQALESRIGLIASHFLALFLFFQGS